MVDWSVCTELVRLNAMYAQARPKRNNLLFTSRANVHLDSLPRDGLWLPRRILVLRPVVPISGPIPHQVTKPIILPSLTCCMACMHFSSWSDKACARESPRRGPDVAGACPRWVACRPCRTSKRAYRKDTLPMLQTCHSSNLSHQPGSIWDLVCCQ